MPQGWIILNIFEEKIFLNSLNNQPSKMKGIYNLSWMQGLDIGIEEKDKHLKI